MTDNQRQLISIIGSSYFQPIADLIEKLLKYQKSASNEVKERSDENGYSSSIILLLVMVLESYVMRVRHYHRNKYPIDKSESVTQYLQKLYPDFMESNELIEIFAVRDSIAHNHLWKIDYSWNEESDMTFIQANKEPSAGDKKYHEVVDLRKMRTKSLQLNIIPIKVGRTDLLRIFDVVWNTLLFLEKKDRRQCYVSHLYFRFKGASCLFSELREKMRKGQE